MKPGMKMKNTKAQGLPLNVIIIAVIALLVLVVIVWIFSGKTSQFTKGIATCESKGGKCFDTYDNCIATGPYVGEAPGDITCDNDKTNPPNNDGDGKYCCVQIK